jgi:hypothetical protein
MDMDQAAVFLAGSILTSIGFIIIIGAIIVVNNMIAKFWKPLGWKFWPESFTQPMYYHSEQEKITPHLDDKFQKESK